MKWICITVMLFISGCAVSPSPTSNEMVSEGGIKKYTNSESGVNLIITNQALKSYHEKYLVAEKHKAFAQSLSGSWSWMANRTSAEHAKTSALVGCQKNNIKNEKLYPCKIINVDGMWSQ